MARELVDGREATLIASPGWRGIVRSAAVGLAAATSVLAVPHLGWVGLVALVAPSELDPALLWLILGASVVIAVLGVRMSTRLRPLDRRAARIGYLIGAIGLILVIAGDTSSAWRDSRAYFDNSLPDPYAVAYQLGGIAYPPPFVQAIAPLVALGWPAFATVWTAAMLFLIDRMLGPTVIAVLLVPLVALDVANGNVNLFIAAALVFGFRWPEVLAVGILSKITPGVGLLWFLARREWRSLARATATTTVVVLLSFAVAPDLWTAWIATATTSSVPSGALDVGPLPLRLVAAGALTVWGAWTDRPWTVPVGVLIAMPVIWPATFSVLIACIPLRRAASAMGERRRAADAALAERVA